MIQQPFPTKNNILISRDSKEGILYYSFKDKSFPLHIVQGNLFKINEKDFNGTIISQTPELQFYEIKTQDGFRTFIYASTPSSRMIGGGGNGKNGIRGLRVEDEGVPLTGFFKTLNFAGAQVVVTDDGGGEATITVGGGGMITGGGTINRLVMFTAPTVIGDSPFLRSGSDVIADGNMYFASGNGIDVVASGGADVLSIGVTNADIINYGYSGTTHNFSGAVFNESTTNLNIKDKLITINDGGAGGSGGSAGFEIEEGGVATGYFIQNSTRNGFDFQASAITGVATFSLALLTANRTATLQNASGTLAYLSDIPVVTGFFAQNGNSFGAPAVLGTNDVFSLSFETSGTTRMTISDTGFIGFNTTPVVNQLMTAVGTGATTASYLFRGYNSTPTEIFSVRNDGYFYGGINGSITFGMGRMFDNTIPANTFFGTAASGVAPTGAGENAGFGDNALGVLTTGIRNASFGSKNMQANTIGEYNCSFGAYTLFSNTTGVQNSAFGYGALFSNTTGSFNTGFGRGALQSLVGNFTNNTAIGFNSFNQLVGGNGNVGLGYYAGTYELGSNSFYLNNQDRVNTAQDKAYSLIYGMFSATNATTTSDQFIRINGNLGILTNTFGTSADGVIGIANATAVPTTSPANMIQIFSVDTDDATASLGLRTEQAVVTEAVISDRTLKVTINGTILKICLKV